MKITTIISFSLVIIGAIVWLLIGLFNFNLVGMIFGMGAGAMISRVIYSLVGLAGLWLIFYWVVYRPFARMD
ncbi:MAG: DUF378 domain-containing protein [Clostridia bacterium]|nr:DUF378 domain-containing protein [Clostridia bacterium]